MSFFICMNYVLKIMQITSSSPKLMNAVSCVLSNKDDRVVTDGLRLADLLVMLLCEGRSALPYPMAVNFSQVHEMKKLLLKL